MALTDILSVALAARDVLGEDKFSDSDCSSVAEAMKKAGLTTYASLRIGFPRDPEARSAMVRGWCKEVKLSDFFELVDRWLQEHFRSYCRRALLRLFEDIVLELDVCFGECRNVPLRTTFPTRSRISSQEVSGDFLSGEDLLL